MIEPGLQGRKVRLRTFLEEDVTDEYVGWLNDPLVTRFSNQRFVRHDRRSCFEYLASFRAGPNLFLSVNTIDGRPIGTMTAYRSLQHGTADIGIMIGARDYWGGGYGQDAWNTLLHWLLGSNVRKVTAGTLACNGAMVRLMERSGMHLEGIRREQEIVEGRPEDIRLYARFRS